MKRSRVLSSDITHRDDLADAGSPMVDSEALDAAFALLDADEQRYFQLNQVEGKTRAKCAATLGWPMAKVERIRRRLNLHLRNLSMPLARGATVKVQIGDCRLFGHVTYSDEEQLFRTGIEIVRVLFGESDLARLVNTILAETMPTTPGVGAVATR